MRYSQVRSADQLGAKRRRLLDEILLGRHGFSYLES
jgi:hypothetical protein